MNNLGVLSRLTELKGAVLGNTGGALLEAVNEADAETIAAVSGFTVQNIFEAGEQLGLGALQKISITGPKAASVIVVQGDSVLTASVDPTRALAPIEKKLDDALRK